jgi:hypothetical protein
MTRKQSIKELMTIANIGKSIAEELREPEKLKWWNWKDKYDFKKATP